MALPAPPCLDSESLFHIPYPLDVSLGGHDVGCNGTTELFKQALVTPPISAPPTHLNSALVAFILAAMLPKKLASAMSACIWYTRPTACSSGSPNEVRTSLAASSRAAACVWEGGRVQGWVCGKDVQKV